jgi:hypothetical protein
MTARVLPKYVATSEGLLLWRSVALMIKANLHAIRTQRRRSRRTA